MAESDEIARFIDEAERATALGDHLAAERALRQALRLKEATFGPIHPEVAHSLNQLGKVCSALGRPWEAEFLYRRALGIARRTVTADHPCIATSLQNLSELYQAQGTPEKLRKVAKEMAPRSGLPESDETPETGETLIDDADSSVETDVGTGVRTDGPVVAPPEHLDSPVDPLAPVDSLVVSRARQTSLGDLFSRPGALLAGIGVLLVSVSWLLFGGSAEPDPVVAEPAGGSAPSVSASVPDVAPAPVLPSPDDEEAPTPPPEPEVERPDPPMAALAAAMSSNVVEAAACSQLDTRGADGAPLAEWRCDAVGDAVAPEQLYFYTRIRTRTNTTVEHRWLRNGVLSQAITLDVEANDGPGYRTYSTRTVTPQERGVWRVELWSTGDDQALLFADEFVVGANDAR